MLLAQLTTPPSSAIPTADPHPLFYVEGVVIGLLVLWVIYTLITAETRKPPPASPAASGGDSSK